jgi:ABC transporter ATM
VQVHSISFQQAGQLVQVTLFNNQQLEVSQYDSYLSQYQGAMVNIEQLSASLNAGQAIILNIGIVAALISAIMFTPGGITPGDLILIQGMLLQLWAPLQFLGWFFRCAVKNFE